MPHRVAIVVTASAIPGHGRRPGQGLSKLTYLNIGSRQLEAKSSSRAVRRVLRPARARRDEGRTGQRPVRAKAQCDRRPARARPAIARARPRPAAARPARTTAARRAPRPAGRAGRRAGAGLALAPAVGAERPHDQRRPGIALGLPRTRKRRSQCRQTPGSRPTAARSLPARGRSAGRSPRRRIRQPAERPAAAPIARRRSASSRRRGARRAADRPAADRQQRLLQGAARDRDRGCREGRVAPADEAGRIDPAHAAPARRRFGDRARRAPRPRARAPGRAPCATRRAGAAGCGRSAAARLLGSSIHGWPAARRVASRRSWAPRAAAAAGAARRSRAPAPCRPGLRRRCRAPAQRHGLGLVVAMMAEQQMQHALRPAPGAEQPVARLARRRLEPGRGLGALPAQDVSGDAGADRAGRDLRRLAGRLRAQAVIHDQRRDRAAAGARPARGEQAERQAVGPAGDGDRETRRRSNGPSGRSARRTRRRRGRRLGRRSAAARRGPLAADRLLDVGRRVGELLRQLGIGLAGLVGLAEPDSAMPSLRRLSGALGAVLP